ncbi:MAG: DUF932 domain-containing protein [Nitrososphaeria archaeon]|jgi:hypothetical protein
MEQIENFKIDITDNTWASYGIVQYIGNFGSFPKRYKIIQIRTERLNENVVRSPGFFPLPNQIARQIAHHIAKELGMEIKGEEESGETYTASMVSQEIKGEVQVGDLVSWGISLSNRITGSFRMDGYLLRLACSNGMIVTESEERSGLKKSHDVERMIDSAIERARFLQDHFEEQLEFFRELKKYRVNREFAERLAKSFPSPIISDFIKVSRQNVVGFTEKDLWSAYNDVTYQLSHRKLKLTTRAEWGLRATKLFREEIEARENAEGE